VSFQFKRLHHIRVQPVQQMRRRSAKTGKEFCRARGTAYLACRFQHQHLAAALRQRGGADEAVVAAADDDGIK
jgi:hypothetical protein